MRAGALAVVLTGALVLSGCTGDTDQPESSEPGVIVPGAPGEPATTLPPGEAAQAAPKQGYNDADVKYVRMMIEHHRQALEMAGLAPSRAARDDVKALAGRITDTQGPDIKAMETWLARNKAPQHEMHGAMRGMATPEQLAALRAASGPAFDKMFLERMIAHHEGALEMAGDLLQTGSDVFVEEMAQDVIVAQQKEIGQMRAMLAG
ncbi:DUF305 domain-containing protein [Kibdelosporangium persicum]|uniref:DUF305 domain-containing protein n=1 Tax=Kibdelosporangium persicum TaxID=2698649 RepID=A0ABX2EZH9_9PSEU|nr:DUF305 domain-containing protein [Kibdelosporangium persicum]NRN64407.1 DUF305 domain-containing protein [Kibdelosporangium persicum]